MYMRKYLLYVVTVSELRRARCGNRKGDTARLYTRPLRVVRTTKDRQHNRAHKLLDVARREQKRHTNVPEITLALEVRIKRIRIIHYIYSLMQLFKA